MKINLIILVLLVTFGCSSKNNSLKLDKSELIQKALIKKGIYSYYHNDTFYVNLSKNKRLAKIYIKPPKSWPDLNRQLDTFYNISQNRDKDIFVSHLIMPSEIGSIDIVVVDLKTNKIIVEQEGYTSYLGSSSDRRYHAFETGSSACGRGFAIYDSNKNLIKQAGYYSCIDDKNQLTWIENKIYYYGDCLKDAKIPDNMPGLKEPEQYVQKFYIVDGIDSITNDFAIASVE